ncbi:plastocyanin/azurin family copper-binding protein [Natrialbaceae archaeon AArc-T1-2]|uniref:plastocyanin/azurin family copper-binding protein n=1 Tax=Natrialbaceae archaeon AArc-T1-2 TaxID=3053904 RepID=UPI00255AFF63|nr:plastocyanin/azurin family copper-binding protein [Natrialbaceae archaeon AArc-T1-2]WIV67835.1 plastocyanin/azurin family copper-binding protein [Natrialbaceae archaeon AArc-T1-2]
MARNDSVSRRTIMKIAGAGTATALIAGCTGNGDDDGNGNGNGDDDNGEEDEFDEADWEDVEEIELDGPTSGWIGVSPDHIDGVENPTLGLVEGREYEITWNNTDGGNHNIAMIDENDEVVEDYETDVMSDEGESQTLTFTATDEIAQYFCAPHPTQMRGDVEIIENDE